VLGARPPRAAHALLAEPRPMKQIFGDREGLARGAIPFRC